MSWPHFGLPNLPECHGGDSAKCRVCGSTSALKLDGDTFVCSRRHECGTKGDSYRDIDLDGVLRDFLKARDDYWEGRIK